MSDDEDFPRSIYLKKTFRIELFCRLYQKEKSLSKIGRVMGYKGRPGLNGTIRDMWVGKNGIPRERMVMIINYLKLSKKNILLNMTTKNEVELISDWHESFRNYLIKNM